MPESKLNEFIEKIDSIGSLPTIPVIALQVLEMLSDPNISFRKLEKVIIEDPAMAAKIMKVANSGYYQTRQEIKSLKMGIAVLGLNEIRNLVFALSVFSSFKKLKNSEYFNYEDFWKHCTGTAKIAFAVVRYLKMDLGESEFVAGLLHDIGRLILQSYFKEEYDEIFKLAIEKNITLFEAEHLNWGFSHQELGAWLAKKWSMPEPIAEAIQYHHTKNLEEVKHKELVAIISLANHVSKMWGVGIEPVPFFTEIKSNPGYVYLKSIDKRLGQINWKDWLGVWDMEMDQAQKFIDRINSHM